MSVSISNQKLTEWRQESQRYTARPLDRRILTLLDEVGRLRAMHAQACKDQVRTDVRANGEASKRRTAEAERDRVLAAVRTVRQTWEASGELPLVDAARALGDLVGQP